MVIAWEWAGLIGVCGDFVVLVSEENFWDFSRYSFDR